MTRGYAKTSPHLFRLIKLALALICLVLLMLAFVLPAPLQEPADLAQVPNPVKSAWFLLWIQELVSYSKRLIFLVIGLAFAAVMLPWLSRGGSSCATWFHRERWIVTTVTFGVVLGILVLTVVAMFLRGTNWRFVLPF